MDIQKETEEFEKFKAKQIGVDYEALKKDLDDCERRFPNNRYAGWNFKSDWELWQAAKSQAVQEPRIDLTGHDIEFITNFMCYSDPENLDTEVTIQKCKSGFDGAGLYAWVSEYPEEGGIKLGESREQSHE